MRPRTPVLAALAACAALATGCVETRPEAFVEGAAPAAPEKRNAPALVSPPAPASAAAAAPAVMPALSGDGTTPKRITPAEAVDIALRNNPATRGAWHAARAAAATVGSRLSAFYPAAEVDGSLARQKQAAFGGRTIYLQSSWGPTAALSWLLLDFGGRAGDVEEARQLLAQASAMHDSVIDDVILRVLQAYYAYEGAKALSAAQEASLKQAEENLKAADERHRAGVATIADVLQARTVASQQRLAYDSVQGQIAVIRGALATALGVPANIPVEAGELPENLDLDRLARTVDDLIATAEKQRPDLAAARAAALAARGHARSVRSGFFPSLIGSASYGRTFFPGPDAAVPFADVYSIGLLLRIPLFTGFVTRYELRKAEEQASVAEAAAAGLEQQMIQQVWSSYYSVKTAAQKIRTARDLVASARESADVTRGRYTAGVGSILDLLTAESSLASARAQDVQARAEFLFALAQLAHDVGSIEPAVKEAP